MKLHEMDGFLRGKCLPGDMKVNESNAEYLVRKFSESREQVQQMAAENAALKSAAEFATAPDMWVEQADGMLDYRYHEWYVDVLKSAMETPATDAAIAALRAEGVEMLAARCMKAADIARQCDDLRIADSLDGEAVRAQMFANELRSQSAPSPEAEQPAASPAIAPLPVERDQYGYWTHPAYDEFADGRDYISVDEFNAWLEAKGIESEIHYRESEWIDFDSGDISEWRPEPPAGNGWFVGSIHDTEDGAVCIWLRNKSEPSQEAVAIARQYALVKGDK